MKRVEVEADQMPGQDSFLDVITNIVGILILLVLVVGLRTSHNVRSGPDSQSAEKTRAEDQLRTVYSSAMSAEVNVRELVGRAATAHDEAEFRDGERMWLTTAVAKAEQEIAERRAKLTQDGQRDFDLRQKLNEAQMQLDELTRQQIALMSQDPASEQLEVEPTTIAKAVTGKEVHLLLSDDHVAIVPFDDLIQVMQDDAKENQWRMKTQTEMERTVGPINGFRVKYCYVKEDVMRSSEAGTYMLGSISRCSYCYFLPVTTPVGEPAADALKPNSELSQYLKGLRPDGTTVTIWTYAGNYDRLRRLKKAIREVGFQIAVRPLPKGMPIGASSHGTRSLSE
jgi:hypothetical protein